MTTLNTLCHCGLTPFSGTSDRLEPEEMNIIKNICTLIVFAALFVLALPLIGAGLGLVVLFGAAFIWLLPILLILNSDKTTGGEKAAWILAIIFLSWFAWIFYFLLAPIKPRRYHRYD
jgi:Na+/proline symporter